MGKVFEKEAFALPGALANYICELNMEISYYFNCNFQLRVPYQCVLSYCNWFLLPARRSSTREEESGNLSAGHRKSYDGKLTTEVHIVKRSASEMNMEHFIELMQRRAHLPPAAFFFTAVELITPSCRFPE